MKKNILLVTVCILHRSFSEVDPSKIIKAPDGKIYLTTYNRRNIDIFHEKSPIVKINKNVYKKPTFKRARELYEDTDVELKSPFSIPNSPYFGLENNKEDVNKAEPEILGTIVRNKRSHHVNKHKPSKKKGDNHKKNAIRDSKKKNKASRTEESKHKNKPNKNNKSNKNEPTKKETNKYKKNTIKKSKKKNKAITKQSKHKNKHSKHRNKRSIPGQRVKRLIAAKDAMIEEYPYVISIQKNEEHWCSGAILNPRVSITTANCLWKSGTISRMLVRAGSRYTYKGGQMAKIQEVVKHPNWSTRKSPDNDVALILLDRNLKFSHSLHGVDLPNREMLPPFDDFWVTSFGSERRDGMYEPRRSMMQVYYARLMDRPTCNDITMRFGVGVSENFICLNQNYKRAPCTRDTGAPAVSDGVLWGLASWGIRKLCGTERYPAMFSYMASHTNMDFILNATSWLMSDKRYRPFYEPYNQPPAIVKPISAASNQYPE